MSEQALYKQIGLVNTREMFKAAMDGKFAIPAYNFNNMEQLQAIVTGCVESDSPVILQVSSGRAQVRQPDAPALHGPGRGRDGQGQGHASCPSPCTSTTATPSSCASRASTPASPR